MWQRPYLPGRLGEQRWRHVIRGFHGFNVFVFVDAFRNRQSASPPKPAAQPAAVAEAGAAASALPCAAMWLHFTSPPFLTSPPGCSSEGPRVAGQARGSCSGPASFQASSPRYLSPGSVARRCPVTPLLPAGAPSLWHCAALRGTIIMPAVCWVVPCRAGEASCWQRAVPTWPVLRTLTPS